MKGTDNLYITFFNSRGDLKNTSVWSWVCGFHTIVRKDTCYFTQHYLRIGYYNEYECVLCKVQFLFVHIITQISDHTSAPWLNKQLVACLSLRRTRLILVQSGWDQRQRGTGTVSAPSTQVLPCQYHTANIPHASYAYWTVHHLDIWIKVNQLDDTCFIMSIYCSTCFGC